MADSIRRLIDDLARAEGNFRRVNQYSAHQDGCDAPDGAAIRCANLEKYLRKFAATSPRLLIVGEAAGYQGCRFSGIPFTSEHALANHPFFAGGGFSRTACRERIWREPTSSIVWELIAELPPENKPMMWATVPFHPHKPGNPLSNRTPTRSEAADGIQFFLKLREIFPDSKLVAAGKIASAHLTLAGFAHLSVRHPSHGGKAGFRTGVFEALRGT